ncbi:DUF5324 family protein [Streptomyces sp. B-S-A8]|uniref:DUF5324 family protein n=1 Tax=Streptomyces solicavernae TaxID=3043614 RepID=A0ABT6RK53_9ACTN|nr:DUF5324 family protein [Streptomyces sp. B-S-A8]MDI3384807.1 DUF5324 family protein [Streptomyces sp. B-S-A8]
MTRIDHARAAASSAKDSVRHAAEVVAPYADTAKDRAALYAHEARVRLAPKVTDAAHQAAEQARAQYGAHLAPRLEQARTQALTHVPPTLDRAAHQTRRAARQAADAARPHVEQAVAAAQPVATEAAARGSAAVSALRGQVSPKEIEHLVRKHRRRAFAGRALKRIGVVGLLGVAAFAAWKWWDKQANPDWLVEPPAPTEVPDSSRLSAVDGSRQDALDPEVRAKQAEAEEAARRDGGDWTPQRPEDS